MKREPRPIRLPLLARREFFPDPDDRRMRLLPPRGEPNGQRQEEARGCRRIGGTAPKNFRERSRPEAGEQTVEACVPAERNLPTGLMQSFGFVV